jgi:hypothetical protein
MNQLNENIPKLLELWLNGSTSLQEEEQLRNYFIKGPVSGDLLKYKPLFVSFADDRKAQSKQIDLEQVLTEHQSLKRKSRIWTLVYSTSGIAAILLALFVYTKVVKDPPPPPPSTQPNAEEVLKAYAETARVMALISEKFNTGMRPMAQLAKINENTERIRVFEQIGKGMEILNHIMPGRKAESETKTENSKNEKI